MLVISDMRGRDPTVTIVSANSPDSRERSSLHQHAGFTLPPTHRFVLAKHSVLIWIPNSLFVMRQHGLEYSDTAH